MKSKNYIIICLLLLSSIVVNGQRQMERLDRGVVAIKVTGAVFLSWRVFGNELNTASYNIYRNGTKIATIPSTNATNYSDNSGNLLSKYSVAAVINEQEQSQSAPVGVWSNFFKEIPLTRPVKGVYGGTYEPHDASVGDLNGDGKYEIILKWEPSNSQDNSVDGYTDISYLDAYTLEGTQMWRINLGKNIRSGAHYTQFLVFDLDGDGISEIVCKTAPGTKDGTGSFLSKGPAASDNDAADYRSTTGRILSGPEYLTVFNGSTGAEITTVNYTPARGTVSSWGDTYGNRCDRFLACIAYLDGVHPSVVMCRGYYARTALTAYDFKNNKLTPKWAFDTYGKSTLKAFEDQGNHNLCVADVDNDGFDEILYGAMCIDHDGSGKYSTGLGHGDAMQCGDFDPDRPGYEVFSCHEHGATNGNVVASFRDANTGEVLYKYTGNWDEGRAACADIMSAHKGAEAWVASDVFGVTNLKGEKVGLVTKDPAFTCWWDGDDYREIMNGTTCDSYDKGRMTTFYNYATATAINKSKQTPNLQADILGDWREEVIFRSADSTKLILFSTNFPTTRRLSTLMHDKMYRLGVAWQNVAYNQPPDVSFFLGGGMTTPTAPEMYYAAKLNQFITFPEIPEKIFGAEDFLLTASSTSTLPVSFISSDTTIVKIINNNMVHIVGNGSCNITAYQAGDSIYNETFSAPQLLKVTPTSVETFFELKSFVYPNPVKNELFVKLQDDEIENITYKIFDNLGRKILTGNLNDKMSSGIDVKILHPGAYIIHFNFNDQQKEMRFIKH